MSNFARLVLLAVALATLTSSAHSAALYCNGSTVAQLSYHGKGTLYVRLANMNTAVGICSFDADWAPAGSLTGTTSPSSCKAIYAALLAAKHSGQPISQMLFDGEQVPANCSSWGPWAQANLRYIDI
jgi:hypothetical protein